MPSLCIVFFVTPPCHVVWHDFTTLLQAINYSVIHLRKNEPPFSLPLSPFSLPLLSPVNFSQLFTVHFLLTDRCIFLHKTFVHFLDTGIDLSAQTYSALYPPGYI